MDDKNIKNLFALASEEVDKEDNLIQNSESKESENVLTMNNLLEKTNMNSSSENNFSEDKEVEPVKTEEQIIDNSSLVSVNNENNNESTNPFVSNNIDADKEEVNPFVKEQEISQNEKPEILNDNQIDKQTVNVDVEEVVNPFVQEQIISQNENTELLNENKIESQTSNIDVKEEVNPFFKDEVSVEEKDNNNLEINPFFSQNMELNEKQEHANDNKLDLEDVQHFKVKIEKKKPRKLKFIIGIFSYAIFVWLLLIGVTLLVYVANIKIKQMKGDYTPPKYNAYVVLTGSMLPSIKVEDVVITKRVEPADLKEGDIITFASSDERFYGTIITHRIKKKYYDSTTKKYTYVSKGDNNNVEDNALVEQDNIHGKVIMKIPKLGYLQIFLASKGGWILVILLPCLAVISFDIMKLLKIVGKKSKIKIAK